MHTKLEAGLPNIIGTTKGDSFRGSYSLYWLSTGALTTNLETLASDQIIAAYDSTVGYNKMSVISFNAQNSNSIYSKANGVQPNSLNVQYLIKY